MCNAKEQNLYPYVSHLSLRLQCKDTLWLTLVASLSFMLYVSFVHFILSFNSTGMTAYTVHTSVFLSACVRMMQTFMQRNRHLTFFWLILTVMVIFCLYDC